MAALTKPAPTCLDPKCKAPRAKGLLCTEHEADFRSKGVKFTTVAALRATMGYPPVARSAPTAAKASAKVTNLEATLKASVARRGPARKAPAKAARTITA